MEKELKLRDMDNSKPQHTIPFCYGASGVNLIDNRSEIRMVREMELNFSSREIPDNSIVLFQGKLWHLRILRINNFLTEFDKTAEVILTEYTPLEL